VQNIGILDVGEFGHMKVVNFFVCNIFQQDVEESIEIYCNAYGGLNSTACKTQLHNVTETVRVQFTLDYERNKYFYYIKMGIWHYRNVIWLRQTAGYGSIRITLSEICEVFPLHEIEDIPEFIWQLAVNYADKQYLK